MTYWPSVELSGCKRYGKGMFTTIYPELAAAVAEKRREHEAIMRRYFVYRREVTK